MAMTFSLLRSTFGASVLKGFRRYYLSSSHSLSSSWEKVAASVPREAVPSYSELDKKFLAGGRISGVDLDLFANAVEEDYQLDELEDLLHRFRRSSACDELMDFTVHAVIRHFVRFKHSEALLRMLDDRVNYGLFPDFYTYNYLMNSFLVEKNFKDAAKTACAMMLQEDFSNDLSVALAVHSCLMYVKDPGSEPWDPVPETTDKGEDDDELKRVRVPFLTIPYSDEHFDLRGPDALVGKTLMLCGENIARTVGNSASLVGATLFKKPEVVLEKLGLEAVASDVVDFITARLDNFGERRGEVEQKLTSVKKLNEDSATLSENHLKATVQKVEQKEISEMDSIYESWVNERKRKYAREVAGKEILARMDKIDQVKEDLKRREQLIFYFDREDKLRMELQQRIPRHFGPPPPHILKFIEKSKKRAAKRTTDYVPPQI